MKKEFGVSPVLIFVNNKQLNKIGVWRYRVWPWVTAPSYGSHYYTDTSSVSYLCVIVKSFKTV